MSHKEKFKKKFNSSHQGKLIYQKWFILPSQGRGGRPELITKINKKELIIYLIIFSSKKKISHQLIKIIYTMTMIKGNLRKLTNC